MGWSKLEKAGESTVARDQSAATELAAAATTSELVNTKRCANVADALLSLRQT